MSVLKRDVEIHKKVELELAQKSQKAQNLINTLAQKVKEVEKAKEELIKLHEDSQKEFKDANNHELEDNVYNLEKTLNDIHKNITDLHKKKDKIQIDSSRVSARIRILHENEHPCIALLLEHMNYLNREETYQSEEENKLMSHLKSKVRLEE